MDAIKLKETKIYTPEEEKEQKKQALDIILNDKNVKSALKMLADE